MCRRLPVGESGAGFSTMRPIFAQGLKIPLRPGRCSDRPAHFAILPDGNTE